MTRKLDWKAAIWAAIIAGLVFMMLEMALTVMLQGQSAWGPPRMIAAMVLGSGVLPPPATFDPMIMMVAMVVHMMVSVALAVVLGLAISRLALHTMASILLGTVFGIVVYLVNFYGFTALFPWFAMARGPISIFSHAMYGAVLGGGYAIIAQNDVGKTEWPTAA